MTPSGANVSPARAFSRSRLRRCSMWRGVRRDSRTIGRDFRPRHFVVPAGRNFRYSPDVQNLVEDFLQYLRHERGQSDNTAKTYAALLGKFTAWAAKQNLADWKQV